MGDSLVLKKHGYTSDRLLGEGSYAKVKRVYSERLKTDVAVKILKKEKAPAIFWEKFLPREREILTSLNHRNIIKAFEIIDTSGDKVYLVMELIVQGNLLEYVKSKGALPEDFSRKLFKQLSEAVKHLHGGEMVHRDLKCENLLLDKDFNLKVADFGFSRRLAYESGKMVLSEMYCGSVAYAAPEVLQAIPHNPKACDVWSMGVVLFVMPRGLRPYDDSNVKKMVEIQKRHHVDFCGKTVTSETRRTSSAVFYMLSRRNECRSLMYWSVPGCSQELNLILRQWKAAGAADPV
ncbi:LOW QUALITY PROTEIN: testis-specific serine/threonine-protein kinase 6 [Polymixia lowei]